MARECRFGERDWNHQTVSSTRDFAASGNDAVHSAKTRAASRDVSGSVCIIPAERAVERRTKPGSDVVRRFRASVAARPLKTS
jgi:hypothetical protein